MYRAWRKDEVQLIKLNAELLHPLQEETLLLLGQSGASDVVLQSVERPNLR